MGSLAVWRVLEEMLVVLRKKLVVIPSEILSNLKTVKVLIEISDSAAIHEDTSIKIERELENIEIYIFSEIQERFDSKTVEKWLRRIAEARNKKNQLKKKTKFISGVPRNQKWICIEPISELPVGVLKKIAKENSLIIRSNADGKFTIYGETENIKKYVKKITKITSEKIKALNK